jgi:polysaccharide export outer membrane protein
MLRAFLIVLGSAAILAGCETPYTRLVKDVPPPDNEMLPPAPARPLAVIGPGDVVDVFVWGYPELSRNATVNFAGALTYPLVGQVPASGKTVDQVEQAVRERLGEYIGSPVVRVSVVNSRPHKFLMLGEVKRPGVYAMPTPDTRLLEGLAQAGGLTADARFAEVLVIREHENKVFVYPIDISKIAAEGRIDNNVVLAEGDIVYVPLLGMANAAIKARRFVDVMAPVLSAQAILLNFQTSTIIWKRFERALKGEEEAQTVVITQ